MNERPGMSEMSARRRGIRLAVAVVLRSVTVLYLLSTLLQAVLASLFITGDVDMLTLHEINSHTNLFLAFLLFLSTILVWRPVRGPVWPVAVTAVLVLAVQTQAGFGYARELALHIPLGVLLFGIAVALTGWAFTPRFDMARKSGNARDTQRSMR